MSRTALRTIARVLVASLAFGGATLLAAPEASAAIEVRRVANGTRTVPTDVVGPICESGDFLAQERDLPPLVAGDLLMVRSAGAYGAVMASTYNTRPLVPEVLVDGDRYAVVRPRQTVEALIAADRVPPWLGG